MPFKCKPCDDPIDPVEQPEPPICEGTPCSEIINDTCVIYTGPDVEDLGIETGDSLEDVITAIVAKLAELSE